MKKSEKHIFINGKIFTSDDSCPYADTMVVEGGRIIWIGTESDMPKEYAEIISEQPHAEDGCSSVTDLQGRRVIPGFADTHMHPVMLADFRKKITAMPPEINSIEDLVEAVRKRREQQTAGEWIEGWGYDEQGFLEKRSPTRYDLDRGCSDSPYPLCVHVHIYAASTVWLLSWQALTGILRIRRAERSNGMRTASPPEFSRKTPAI